MDSEVSQGTASGNEVPVVARRRRHTRSYKLKILAQADRCTRHGELVALARREGLYASTLNRWKEWMERMQAGETPTKRRSKSEGYETLRNQLRQAERENHRLLSGSEEQQVLDLLNSERFADRAVPEIYATLLDEGVCLCSMRTMYRILKRHGEVRERRNQLRHPVYTKPELLATPQPSLVVGHHEGAGAVARPFLPPLRDARRV